MDPRCITLIVIGDFGVGKTSLLMRFCDDTYSDNVPPTVGVDAKERDIMLPDIGEQFRLIIRDTAGTERFAGVTCSSFRGVLGVVLAFDITDRNTFDSLVRNWINEVQRYANDRTKLCVVGTKADLAADRKVDEAEVQAWLRELASTPPPTTPTNASKKGKAGSGNQSGGGGGGSSGMSIVGGACIPYMETSAKNSANVDEMFIRFATAIVQDRTGKKDSGPAGAPTLNLHGEPPKKKGRCALL
eukprot:TRINITY_DN2128_c0_g1_i1.p1 TRINITY_DN2128_c0_g1~~TRINITY_DN2128_c0_g1_i1.p1  ORF type:complete len:278 (-),score=54.23 TRINITY_DN2128_c0_g1_i1:133-864(-)